MAVNKVTYGSDTLIDLTGDTVTESDLKQGVIAHDKSGNSITGTLTIPEQQEKTLTDLLLVYGRQTVVPDDGKTLSRVIIVKPDTLIPENVKKDVNIAGVIGTSEPTLQEKTVTPSTSDQSITPDTGYDGLSKVDVNAIPVVEQATPSITVNSTGLITASATQTEGYVTSGTKSATEQLTKQLGKTVTPGTSDVVAVETGKYTTGTVYVKGDSNLVPENIKKDVSIFGVTGTMDGPSTPSIGFVPSEWNSEGYIKGGAWYGTTIPKYAFCNNSYSQRPWYLFSIDLPSDLESIGSNAFQDCNWLQLTSLPSGVTYIGDNAFKGCTYLKLKTLPSGITYIGGSAFYSCSYLPLEELPNGITVIYNDTFHGCSKMTISSLPSSLAGFIGSAAFYGCSKITISEIPNGVTKILSSAFRGCTSITISSIPPSVTDIQYYAFYGCTGLTTLTFEGTPTGTIDAKAFTSCSNLVAINVPWSEGAVANAPWGATNATITYDYTGG